MLPLNATLLEIVIYWLYIISLLVTQGIWLVCVVVAILHDRKKGSSK